GGPRVLYVGWTLLCAEPQRAVGCGAGWWVPADWAVSLQHRRRMGSIREGAAGDGGGIKSNPQWLKPQLFCGRYGPAEAGPFPIQLHFVARPPLRSSRHFEL